MDRNTKHRAVVISGGISYRGDGTTAPAQRIGVDLAALLSGSMRHCEPQCTFVLDDVVDPEIGEQEHQWKMGGWTRRGGPAWSTFHREGRTVVLGLRSEMELIPLRYYGVLVDADTDPGVLALLLDRYQLVTGTAWRGTPATTAHNGIRLTWENSARQPLWHEPVNRDIRGVGFMRWSRPLTETEHAWGYLHTFDANGAYLGSAINAELPWSALQHSRGPRTFDPAEPGAWSIRPGAELLAWNADPARPPLFGNRHRGATGLDRDGTVQVTTPYARFLAELGPFTVVDAHTAAPGEKPDGRRGHPAGVRITRAWAEHIRDARTITAALPTGLRDILEDSVSRTYKDAVGGMQREQMPITRHIWGWTITDLWRATLYRAMIRVHTTQGVWPTNVATDSVTYADSAPTPTPSPDPRFQGLSEALGVAGCNVDTCRCRPREGGRLGTWKHETTTETGEHNA